MRLLARVSFVLLLATASNAYAGDKPKLPKPVDCPVVRPKVLESHKAGNSQRHPEKYLRPDHGNEWKSIFREQRAGSLRYPFN